MLRESYTYMNQENINCILFLVDEIISDPILDSQLFTLVKKSIKVNRSYNFETYGTNDLTEAAAMKVNSIVTSFRITNMRHIDECMKPFLS